MESVFGRTGTQVQTPWGESQDRVTIAPGVVHHSAAGHGGLYVDAELTGTLERAGLIGICTGAGLEDATSFGTWWEEDCAGHMVVLVLCDRFQPGQIKRAIEAAEWLMNDERRPILKPLIGRAKNHLKRTHGE